MLPIAHGLAMALTMLRAYERCGNGVKNGAKTGLSSVFFASYFRLYAPKDCAALTNRGEFAFLGGSPPFLEGGCRSLPSNGQAACFCAPNRP